MSANGNNKLTIDCPHCNQRFSVIVSKTEIFNSAKVSMAVTTHEKPIKCICGGSCVLVAQQIQTAWGIVPLTEQQVAALEGSPIILPPLGARLIN
jgi:hypothetical protein